MLEPKFSGPLEVIAPSVDTPAFRAVAKRLVVDAVVEKKLVEVALVVVPNVFVRARIVDDELTKIPRVEVGARYPFPCTDQSLKRLL